MRKTVCFLFLLGCLYKCNAQGDFQQPKLVVGIVVDQMRADYIYRYWDNLSENGFKRLIKEGFECANTHYNYMPTYTGPGHASIYTGATPMTHGIIGNNWYDEHYGNIYCASDTSVQGIGTTGKAGQMSPRRMLTTTIADELRLFTNFRSKVIGVSLKDRGSIFPAGHSGQAYWFENVSGNFITSTYYSRTNELPVWLVQFNDKKLASGYLNGIWKPLYPMERYRQSTADDTPYENILDHDPAALPVFNYDLKKISSSEPDLLRKTPFGNSMTVEMAMAAVNGEQLGEDTVCDMLLVSFSSTDYIGHFFGTNAVETEDTYLRLDSDLAKFMSFLDKKFGKSGYMLFLTADHGGLQNPVFLNDNKLPGGFIYTDKITAVVKTFLQKNYGDSALFSSFMNYQIWLNDALIDNKKIDRAGMIAALSHELMKLDYIADVITYDELTGKQYTSGVHSMIQKGYNRKRSGDLTILYQPGYIEAYGQRRPTAGTDHGSPYRYDTHVPLYFMGWKIKTGRTTRAIEITDVAATVSSLLNISQPSGCIGKPITEITQ